MSVRDKWVRRFSVDETTKHKNGFTIYKITSVLFPLESPEAVTVVSVWKRYSDVQRLHKSMRSLHTGLHLRGTFPTLAKSSFFKRFQQEIIDERAKSIKTLLEFVAEHRLLFASTDFVNFLQTGYPEPEPKSSVINAIRSSLHLPIEETPPLEYQTSDDDTRSPTRSARSVLETPSDGNAAHSTHTELDVSQIPIYEAADVEIRESPKTTPKLSITDSFESINSLPSIDFELYDEVNRITVDKSKPSVRSRVLPDLIIFDAPSTSFDDYHTMRRAGGAGGAEPDAASLGSTACDSLDGTRSALSLSAAESGSRTEDSYVFEAGYVLNLAARCEDTGDYQRAFEYYKSGIEKMLIGVQSDSNPERRAVIKQKTNKYLSYAEAIYKRHLFDGQRDRPPAAPREEPRRLHCPVPLSMLRRPYEELAQYRVLAVLADSVMLVLHRSDQACYAMKVIQKVPNNLTEFDEYFQQRASECRQPVLPTLVPYMVPLHALVETAHLYFLILSYAPGEKLFDYIRSYASSIPTTPAREVNLENVFAEPINKIDIENDNIDVGIDVVDSSLSARTEYLDSVNENVVASDPPGELSVNELVINSQRLLLNVDRVLSETSVSGERKREGKTEADDKRETQDGKRVETNTHTRPAVNPRELLPPSAVCKWGAEILTALESLHNSGVICRDLNPSNILLGEQGQVILTYFVHYAGADMALAQARRAARRGPGALYVAPELLRRTHVEERGAAPERACDFWSFGAVMYELLCGAPLSQQHAAFGSHTELRLPDGLPVDARSLLAQLLTYEPSERLGAGKDGIAEIKQHPYFRHVDWQSVYDGWIVPD